MDKYCLRAAASSVARIIAAHILKTTDERSTLFVKDEHETKSEVGVRVPLPGPVAMLTLRRGLLATWTALLLTRLPFAHLVTSNHDLLDPIAVFAEHETDF